jgi:hypothetical protein
MRVASANPAARSRRAAQIPNGFETGLAQQHRRCAIAVERQAEPTAIAGQYTPPPWHGRSAHEVRWLDDPIRRVVMPPAAVDTGSVANRSAQRIAMNLRACTCSAKALGASSVWNRSVSSIVEAWHEYFGG